MAGYIKHKNLHVCHRIAVIVKEYACTQSFFKCVFFKTVYYFLSFNNVDRTFTSQFLLQWM